MSLRKLLPQGEVTKETIQDLASVFEGERLHKEHRYEQAAIKDPAAVS